MRHRVKKHLKFNNKDCKERNTMERNLVTQIFLHKSIKTTEKRAKAIIPMIDRLINFVNAKNEMNAIRFVMRFLFTKESSLELFKNVAPKYKGQKTSGFTRITPVKYREGDCAKLVLIELI